MGTFSERFETLTIEGVQYLAEGYEIEEPDGEHNESLAIDLSSGVRIEFGGYASDDPAFDFYRQEILPVLKAILETFESFTPEG
jgi:hypothetical protein